MRIAPAITLSPEQRTVLESQARSRSLPVRVAERARIVLFAASGQQDKEIAASMAITPKKVSRWRKRFLVLGMVGLQKDAPRPGRKPTIGTRVTKRVVALTTRQQPTNATHWSTRTMAAAVGISEASVRRIWRAHGLKPHRVETFKISNDPQFAEKLEDIVGLYLNPPEHALVLCADEKSQIQALDRTQPGLPLKRGRGATMTHNYATHKHPKVQRWLARHPRFHLHFTPTSASWLNMVERFFRDLTQNRLRRGVFRDLEELIMAIGTYIDRHNESPKPFIWTARAADILEKVKRARRTLNKRQSA
jgi:transposase